jgi:hypothetical protein
MDKPYCFMLLYLHSSSTTRPSPAAEFIGLRGKEEIKAEERRDRVGLGEERRASGRRGKEKRAYIRREELVRDA